MKTNLNNNDLKYNPSRHMNTYFFESLTREISLISIGHTKCTEKDIMMDFRFLNYYSLHYVANGQGFYEYNHQKYSVKKGDLFLIYPYQNIKRYPDPQNCYEIYWIDFSGSSCQELLSRTNFSQEHRIICNMDNLIFPLFCELYLKIDSHQAAMDCAAFSTFYNIITVLIQQKQTKPNYFSSDKNIQKIVNYIENNYQSETLCLESIALELGFNSSYLSRMFHKKMGQKLSTYISGFRIQKAMEFINSGLYTPQEVYSLVGFSDYVYFSKLFKKYHELTPVEHYKNIINKRSKVI